MKRADATLNLHVAALVEFEKTTCRVDIDLVAGSSAPHNLETILCAFSCRSLVECEEEKKTQSARKRGIYTLASAQ